VKQSVAEKKAVMIDVREQKEWDAGHLADAKLVPLSKLSAGQKDKAFAEKLANELPKDKVVYCHCRSGGRVLPAADILKDLGYDVRPLKAGYQDLLDAGFPKAK
jgi:rhodanese-related sulfurtransferase